MRLRLLAVLATLVLLPGVAWADSQISINPGNLGQKAADAEQECGGTPGGPYGDRDVWVFNLPGNYGTTGDFVSITATFDTPGGAQTFTIPGDGGAVYFNGHSKAYIALPAGWTLTAATAVITGTAAQFVLTHACAADPGEPPFPSPSPSPSPTATPSVTQTPGGTPTPGSSGTPATPGDPQLPQTGAPVLTLALSGIAIGLTGAGMLWHLRRRRLAALADIARLEA